MNKDRETIIVVRKRGHAHAHHGGAWKVAFADFMTAMFALFLVLWLVNQSSDVKAAIAGYFQDPLGRAEHRGTSPIEGEGAPPTPPRALLKPGLLDARTMQLQSLAERIRREVAERPEFGDLAKFLEIEVTPEGLRIQLLEDSTGVFFMTGSAVPRPRVVEFLGLLGRQLASLPNDIVVDGHTDALPYSASATYTNWELSADRANAARRILHAGGLPEGQVAQVRGHADRDLRLPDQPTNPANRRVTITMLVTTPLDSLAPSMPDTVRAALGATAEPRP